MTKTLVVGLDAATWDIVDPLLNRGGLPNLDALISDGVRGPLQSTTPPMTPLAWTSAATGVNPGKHGIFGFKKRQPGSYRIRPANYDDIEAPAIWDIFNHFEERVCVVNFPVAHPPPEIDSAFVSGFPFTEDQGIYAPSDIGERFPEYRVQPETDPRADPDVYFDELTQLAEARYDLTLDLVERHDPALVWTIFMGIDWAQHYLWHEKIDGEDAIVRLYRYFDGLLGRVREDFGDKWDVLLLSDHGATEISGEVHTNTWLDELDYLQQISASSASSGFWDTAVNTGIGLVSRLPPRVQDAIRTAAVTALPDRVLDPIKNAEGLTGQDDLHERIDWSSTEAFAYDSMGQVFVNLEGEYPDGQVPRSEYESICESLVDELESLCDPENGEPIIEAVRKPETVYEGNHTDDAPDLIVIPRDWDYMFYGDLDIPWIHPPRGRFADHHPEGMFVYAGPSVSGDSLDAEIADITPTLLYAHDIPVAATMDGVVLTEVFDDGPSDSVEHVAHYEGLDRRVATGTAADEDDVTDRLEDLGYM